MKKYLLYFILQGLVCGYFMECRIKEAHQMGMAEVILEKPLAELTEYRL
jgi:hypothetical protein